MTSDQIESIIENFNLASDYFIWQVWNATELMDDDERLQTYYSNSIMSDTIDNDQDYEKILALMEHTGDDWDSAESDIDRNFKVLTDDEAEEQFVESIRSYAEYLVSSEVPDNLIRYFDMEQYIEDLDISRGEQLAPYDSNEYEVSINGTTYYIYKQ